MNGPLADLVSLPTDPKPAASDYPFSPTCYKGCTWSNLLAEAAKCAGGSTGVTSGYTNYQKNNSAIDEIAIVSSPFLEEHVFKDILRSTVSGLSPLRTVRVFHPQMGVIKKVSEKKWRPIFFLPSFRKLFKHSIYVSSFFVGILGARECMFSTTCYVSVKWVRCGYVRHRWVKV